MQLPKFVIPALMVVAIAAAFRGYGWPGVAFVVSVMVLWMLLNFNRTMQVMRRAADRPIGFVGSAVMLNAKLKPGMTLLHVVAMTRALGELRSPQDEQPELYRWTDAGGSYVDCTFVSGKVSQWTMSRPVQDADPVAEAPATAP
jgi:hypothetical protein